MSMTFTRGGFYAGDYAIDNTNVSSEHQRIARNFVAQLIALFRATNREASAQGSTPYWVFHDGYLTQFSEDTEEFTAEDLCGTDSALMNDLTSAAGISSTKKIAIRANLDTAHTHPCYATILHGRNGEALYLLWCSGYIRTDATSADTGYGLQIHPKNCAGASPVAAYSYTSKGSFHIWYNPSGGVLGSWSPANSGFLINQSTWCMDGGFAGRATDVTMSPTATQSFRSADSVRHVVMCKDGVIIFGAKNTTTSSYPYMWLVLGRNIIDCSDVDTSVGMISGILSLRCDTTDIISNQPCLMASAPSNTRPSSDCIHPNLKTHAADAQGSYATIHYQLQMTLPIVTNRLAGQPMPLSPIAVVVYPYVALGSMNSTCTLFKGQGLIGYVRGDILRCVFGGGLTEYNTIDNGNYIVGHSAGPTSYTLGTWVAQYRIILGWDSSNEVVL